MPVEERRAFEAELARDPELEALVHQHRLEHIGLELLVERDLRAKMELWDRETDLLQQLRPKRAKTYRLIWIARAAAVALVLAAGYWFIIRKSGEAPAPQVVQTRPERKGQPPAWRKPQRRNEPTSPSSAEVAQNELPPAPIEEMQPEGPAIDYAAVADDFFREQDFLPPRGVKGGSAAYLQGLRSLQDGRYQDITQTIKPDLLSSPTTEVVQQQELLAVAHYQSRQYADAETTFRYIATTGIQPYAQRAEWGLVLSLLKQMPQRRSALQPALEAILSRPEHPFYAKAQQLAKHLKVE